jgi:hypothetical protein
MARFILHDCYYNIKDLYKLILIKIKDFIQIKEILNFR